MSISDTAGGARSRPDQVRRLASVRSVTPDGRTDHAQFQAIGLDPGTGGGTGTPPPPAPASPPRPDIGPDPGIVTPSPAPPSQGERPCTQWVIWERWFTMHDERVCPECGPLHGQQFEHGSGPQPPLHSGCRCFRQEVHRECVARRAGGAGVGENY